VVQKRDFIEKKVKFSKDGKIYVLFSAAPDEIKMPDAKISRAYTVLGLMQF